MSNSTSVQRHTQTEDLDRDVVTRSTSAAGDPDRSPFALKQQVAERLAAHRARRPQSTDAPEASAASPRAGRSAQIVATVAERYAQSPSYRAFLASEAERSVREAEAAADVALINAKAIAVAQQQMLADLEHWDPDPEDFARGPIAVPSPLQGQATYTPLPVTSDLERAWTTEARHDATPGASFSGRRVEELPMPAFTVRHYDITSVPAAPDRPGARFVPDLMDDFEDAEGMLLDEEIAFRHDPIFDEPADNSLPATANLLEFPRQLVAARRARPRLAEGPLREDSPDLGQLRIFEVDADQISDQHDVAVPVPEWSSMLLAAHPHTALELNPDTLFSGSERPNTAPLRLRITSSLIDGGILLGTLTIFLGVATAIVTRYSGLAEPIRVSVPLAAGLAGVLLLVLTVVYLLIFFSLAESTPGMRCARIALCTFADENPTRSAMRRRLLFTLLAILPLGLGIFWAFLDEDGLGWHDRLSGMYQRSY